MATARKCLFLRISLVWAICARDWHLLLWDSTTMREHFVWWSQTWQRWFPTLSWRVLHMSTQNGGRVMLTWHRHFACVTAYRMYEGNMREDQRAVSTFVLTCDVEWKFLASIVPADVTSIYGTASSDARLRCLRFRGANQHPVTQNTHNLRLVTVLVGNKERNAPTDRPTKQQTKHKLRSLAN